jgi:16S rRNA G527 N7-methylase RsmG
MGAFPRADLIESRKKRAVFLRRTCQDLGLSGCQVHACRFSAFVEQKREARIAGAGAPAWITVQGVRPSPELWNKISEIRRQPTRIVWFTGTGGAGAESPSESLILPYSGRRALIFGPIHA